MPTGPQLLEEIGRNLKIMIGHGYELTEAQAVIWRCISQLSRESNGSIGANSLQQAAWKLSAASGEAMSIDNAIHALSDPKIEIVGKLAIAYSILSSEGKCSIFNPNDGIFPDMSAFRKTWYSLFAQILFEGVKIDHINMIFNNLSLINFNYDRCIENYLSLSLANYYGIDINQSQDVVKRATILRPYGRTGKLPWQLGPQSPIQFGKFEPQIVLSAIGQIRTFTERVIDEGELGAIKDCLMEADRIVFLGFAYYRQNLRVLRADIKSHARVMGTAFGISNSDKDVVKEELAQTFGMQPTSENYGRIELADMKCKDFFESYWRTLTAEKPESRV